MPKLKKIIPFLFYFYLFLLPFQTRYIYNQTTLNGGAWEYGTRSLYATEILLMIILVLFVFSSFYYLIKNNSKISFAKITRQNLKSPRIVLPLLFLFWAAISILWAENKSLAFYKWTILLEGIIVFLFLAKKIISGRISTIAFIGGSLIQAVLSIYQFLTQKISADKWLGIAYHIPEQAGASVVETPLRRWLRAYGSLPHPNVLAAYLGIALILFIIFIPFLTENIYTEETTLKDFLKILFKNFILALSFFLISAGILLTFSRAAWLGLVLSSFICVIYIFCKHIARQGAKFTPFAKGGETEAPSKRDIPLKKINIFALGFGALLLIAAFSLRDPILGRIKGGERLEKISNQGHISTCREGWQIIKNKWLSGTGIGNYTLYLSRLKPGLSLWNYQPAHNLFLMIWAEMGIIGLIIFILICYYLIAHTIKNKKYFYPALTVFILSISLFDHYFWTLYVGVVLWWFANGIILNDA